MYDNNFSGVNNSGVENNGYSPEVKATEEPAKGVLASQSSVEANAGVYGNNSDASVGSSYSSNTSVGGYSSNNTNNVTDSSTYSSSSYGNSSSTGVGSYSSNSSTESGSYGSGSYGNSGSTSAGSYSSNNATDTSAYSSNTYGKSSNIGVGSYSSNSSTDNAAYNSSYGNNGNVSTSNYSSSNSNNNTVGGAYSSSYAGNSNVRTGSYNSGNSASGSNYSNNTGSYGYIKDRLLNMKQSYEFFVKYQKNAEIPGWWAGYFGGWVVAGLFNDDFQRGGVGGLNDVEAARKGYDGAVGDVGQGGNGASVGFVYGYVADGFGCKDAQGAVFGGKAEANGGVDFGDRRFVNDYRVAFG